jgi:lipopolysaccharide/colanic/teichoic acid biosynthesis glycosyltransferase
MSIEQLEVGAPADGSAEFAPLSDPEIDLSTGGCRDWAAARATDFTLALALLLLSIPILLAAAAMIRLTSPGPVVYTQSRLGRHAKPYTIYKIRTMTHECERVSGVHWCVPGDPRVTRVGRLLRCLHIDELPQLVNVLRGEMSLVGPRPERPEIVERLEKDLPGYRERLLVRPGITGLAQIQLPPDADLESVRRKLALDRCYVRLRSPWLDLRILMGTCLHVLRLPSPLIRAVALLPGGAEPYPAAAPQLELALTSTP